MKKIISVCVALAIMLAVIPIGYSLGQVYISPEGVDVKDETDNTKTTAGELGNHASPVDTLTVKATALNSSAAAPANAEGANAVHGALGIAIQVKPTKLEYQRKDPLDLTGMVVVVMYDNGSTEVITDYAVSGYNASKIGLQIVTIAYGDYNTSFLVAVNQSLVKGDINYDDGLDTSDARVMLRKIVGLEEDFTKEELLLVDMNEDGKVNSADVRQVLFSRVSVSFTVTFKDYDGKVLKTETVESGKTATAPSTPARDGYTFAGWDSDFSNVTSDLVVTATYTKNAVPTYTVTFKDYDGKVLKTETVESGKSATAPTAPSREGYTFSGWSKSFNNITEDLVVTATYTPISTETYTVTFKDYNGTTLATKTVNAGSAAELPANPSKSGVAFLGWSGNYVNVTKDETVTAVYSDSQNVFIVESVTGSVGDSVTVLVSVDGSVKTCGFRFDLFYDPALELVSYDNDLDLDIIVNDTKYENGINLNFSAATDKTKQRDIIELTFRINDTTKTSLPIWIEMTEVFEVTDSGAINNVFYEIIDGVVTVE